MSEEMNLEQQKQIFQKTPFLLAKGLTRAEVCHIMNILQQKSTERIMDVLLGNPGIDKNESKQLLHTQTSNDFIELQYTMQDGKLYNLMKNNILNNLSNNNLKEQMKQCFMAYENDMYYSCACGLLPLVERVMVNSKTSLEYNWNNIEEYLKVAFKTYFDDSNENNMEEYTIRLIVKMLAQRIEFTEEEPDEFNRHWLLHGRAERMPNKTDCLKLFNIIELIIDIKLKHNQCIL